MLVSIFFSHVHINQFLQIYKYDIETIVKRLEDTKKQFEGELLEIYSSPLLLGFIFLRVTYPCCDLLDTLRSTSGIGGVNNFEGKKPLEVFSRQFSFLKPISGLNCNDLVIVKIGPLRDHIGRVSALEVSSEHVQVELNIFGKMITTEFSYDEVQSVSKEK